MASCRCRYGVALPLGEFGLCVDTCLGVVIAFFSALSTRACADTSTGRFSFSLTGVEVIGNERVRRIRSTAWLSRSTGWVAEIDFDTGWLFPPRQLLENLNELADKAVNDRREPCVAEIED